jgi:hypothetical protein
MEKMMFERCVGGIVGAPNNLCVGDKIRHKSYDNDIYFTVEDINEDDQIIIGRRNRDVFGRALSNSYHFLNFGNWSEWTFVELVKTLKSVENEKEYEDLFE